MLNTGKAEIFLREDGLFADIGTRKIGAERGTALWLTVDENVGAALLHDAVNRGQTKACAFGTFRGEERFEDARLGVTIHADASVTDGEHDVVAWKHGLVRAREILVDADIGGLDGKFSSLRHGVARVDRQVHDDLIDLAG